MTNSRTATFSLTCKDFQANQKIPKKFTCDGNDISPELQWHGAPDDTKSFVLIMDDPDAPSGTWDHWILFNIPKDTTHLEENIKKLPNGTGKNSWDKAEYGGPCPPNGEHHYVFKIYALDCTLELATGTTKQDIKDAMQGHVLAEAQLVGKYKR